MEHMKGLDAYLEELEDFISSYKLPPSWFVVPDHVAIKCSDGMDYEDTVEEFKPHANQISQIEMDGRRLGAVKLSGEIAVASFGEVSWIEVMEPRPEKVGKDVVGIEHMEFFYPDFEEIEDMLRVRNIRYELQTNPGHSWINIVINDKGQELKLNNKLLGDTVASELKNGENIVLYDAKNR